jgi:hypothetical protein
MSEPTTNRKELRRTIARALQMEFFKRYADGELALTGTPTTTSLASSSLTQSQTDYWKGGWVYIASGAQLGAERRITTFNPTGDILTPEYPLAGAPASGDKIEIHDLWSPTMIHQAINRALKEAGRVFFDSNIDSTLVARSDRTLYDISAITPAIWKINQIWIEQVEETRIFQPSAVETEGSYHLITLPAGMITADDQYNGWYISAYDGPGAGQSTTITDTALVGRVITVATANFTTAPTTDTYLRIWNANSDDRQHYQLTGFRVDDAEFPNKIWVDPLRSDLLGYRLMIQYAHLPVDLTTDTSATTVPQEYIVNKARAFLHEDRMNDNRPDSARHAQLAQTFHGRADDYLMRYPRRHPAGTVQTTANHFVGGDAIDPMGWRG